MNLSASAHWRTGTSAIITLPAFPVTSFSIPHIMFSIMRYFIVLFCAGVLSASGSLLAQDSVKPNIIFLIIDDLNDYTTTLKGHPQSPTPNISEIEGWGTTFTNANCSSPKCAPSRTSFITGKDLIYTQQYNNVGCKPFRDYFTEDDDNEFVYTMPEYFKDYGGYYTYGINKINHCFDRNFDYDSTTLDPCSKSLSWNKYSLFIDGDDSLVRAYGNDYTQGVTGSAWCPIPDEYEPIMYDYRAVDSASQFVRQYNSGELDACGRPFFMYVGFRKPHQPWFVPEKYFSPYYCDDFYVDPLDLPYNEPTLAYPYNGLLMPPQPETLYGDFFNLPDAGLAQYMAAYDSVYFDIQSEVNGLSPLPYIADDITDDERRAIMRQVYSANAAMAYMACVSFLDAQIGRFIDSLMAYPEIANNTIIVLASDHGFSLGEKRHWEKGTMWETDQRVPLVISDLRAPEAQISHNAVSLLDIFPTLCDLTETPYPQFPDGTPYLDGQSLKPILDDATVILERPALSAYEEHNGGQLSCRPQYSLRNDRFHYILYTSNGPEGTLDCDAVNYYTEEELYEIGTDRSVDPNEWNNLAYDPDYAAVIDYMQQWLPDSALYLQRNYVARIQQTATECLLDSTDDITLAFDMFDTNGASVTPPDSFTYVWSNNLTDTLLYGTSATFSLTNIPDSVFEASSRMIWYLHVYDGTGVTKAFDLRYYYLNLETEPYVSFTLTRPDSFTVQVTDFVINGSYRDIRWDFGAGEVIEDDIPGPYTYPDNGSYTITCMVTYGNTDDCVVEESAFLNVIEQVNTEQLTVYPNPNNGTFTVSAVDPFDGGMFRLYSISGQLLYEEEVPSGTYYDLTLETHGLAKGVYQLLYVNNDKCLGSQCVVVGKE